MVNWQLWKQAIRWPVSHDHIEGSKVELVEVASFLKVDRWPVYGFPFDLRLKYNYNLSEQAKNSELRF